MNKTFTINFMPTTNHSTITFIDIIFSEFIKKTNKANLWYNVSSKRFSYAEYYIEKEYGIKCNIYHAESNNGVDFVFDNEFDYVKMCLILESWI